MSIDIKFGCLVWLVFVSEVRWLVCVCIVEVDGDIVKGGFGGVGGGSLSLFGEGLKRKGVEEWRMIRGVEKWGGIFRGSRFKRVVFVFLSLGR